MQLSQVRRGRQDRDTVLMATTAKGEPVELTRLPQAVGHAAIRCGAVKRKGSRAAVARAQRNLSWDPRSFN